MTQVLTYSTTKPPPAWVRWLMTPIGWPTHAAVVFGALCILWTMRVPGPHPAPVLLEFVCTCMLAVWVSMRFFIRMVLWHAYRRPWREFWGKVWRYLVPVTVGAVVVLLVAFDIPVQVAWHISKPGLQRLADDVIAKSAGTTGDQPIIYPPRWVGVYLLNEVAYLPQSHGVRVSLADAGFMDRFGFAYFPNGTPPAAPTAGDPPGVEYQPHDGKWFRTFGF